VNFFGLSEITNGLAVSLEDSFDDDASGTYLYNEQTGLVESLTMGGGWAERLHPLDGNKALALVRTVGFFLIEDVMNTPELMIESDNSIFVSAESMSIACSEEGFAFTEVFKRDVFYSDGSAAGTQLAQATASFGTEFVTKDNHAFIAFGTSNGFDPELYHIDLLTGVMESIYAFNEPSTNIETVIPIAYLDGTLYFSNLLDQTIGRELFGLDVDFTTTATTEIDSSELLTILQQGNSLEVRTEESKLFNAQIFSLDGKLIDSISGMTNEKIVLPEFTGLTIIQVETDKQTKSRVLSSF